MCKEIESLVRKAYNFPEDNIKKTPKPKEQAKAIETSKDSPSKAKLK